MVKAPTVRRARTTPGHRDHLDVIVRRVAAGDRVALRRLYAFLAMPVWRAAVNALGDQIHAMAVTRSTFLEVWHLARHHGTRRTGTGAWVAVIVAGRIADRLRILDGSSPLPADHDGHMDRELASLLGAGPAIVRVGRATFARVDHLDLALATIAARRTATRH